MGGGGNSGIDPMSVDAAIVVAGVSGFLVAVAAGSAAADVDVGGVLRCEVPAIVNIGIGRKICFKFNGTFLNTFLLKLF